jgi:coenzyme PQQ biosynthesis protein PqqD
MNDGPPWKPRLAPRARVKFDAVGGQDLLLFPEAALVLNETAAAIVRLCDGERTVGAIIDELAGGHAGSAPAAIGDDVRIFLTTLRARGLLE